MKPQDALQRVIENREIFHDEMVELMRQVMRGEVSPVLTAGILAGREASGERRQIPGRHGRRSELLRSEPRKYAEPVGKDVELAEREDHEIGKQPDPVRPAAAAECLGSGDQEVGRGDDQGADSHLLRRRKLAPAHRLLFPAREQERPEQRGPGRNQQAESRPGTAGHRIDAVDAEHHEDHREGDSNAKIPSKAAR